MSRRRTDTAAQGVRLECSTTTQVPSFQVNLPHYYGWVTSQKHPVYPFAALIILFCIAIRSDTASELITIDRDYLDRIRLRKSLIQSQGQMVHGCIPAGVDAVSEIYTYLLEQYLPKRYPTMFTLSADSSELENLVIGDTHSITPPVDPSRALQIVGTTVEEDLFVLKPTPEGHQCVAFICCFPSGWSPSSKLGKLMKQIHSNVPSYDKIGPSMERFFTKLEVGKNVKRTNACHPLQNHFDVHGLTAVPNSGPFRPTGNFSTPRGTM